MVSPPSISGVPGDVAGGIRGEEHRGSADLLGLARPSEAVRPTCCAEPLVLPPGRREAGFHQPRGDGVHPDASGSELLGEGLGHGDHRRLGHAVDALKRRGPHAGDAGHIEDHPRGGRTGLEVLAQLSSAQEVAPQVYLEGLVPAGLSLMSGIGPSSWSRRCSPGCRPFPAAGPPPQTADRSPPACRCGRRARSPSLPSPGCAGPPSGPRRRGGRRGRRRLSAGPPSGWRWLHRFRGWLR